MNKIMTIMQKTMTVKAEVHPEQIPDVIEWDCSVCRRHNIEYTYHIEDRKELQCKSCGSTFARE